MKKYLVWLFLCFLSVISFDPSKVYASMLDLTTSGSTGTIDGVLFHQFDVSHASPGQLNPFVRIQNNGTEQGYNTSGRTNPGNNAPFDGKQDLTYTHDLRLSDLSERMVNINNIDYYEFILNTNENNSSDGRFLSLDAIQIYLSDTGSKTTTNVSNLGTKIYDLGDNWIKLDDSLSSGIAIGDMIAYVPTSLFSLQNVNDPYVYFYSKMGVRYGSDGGFEEWGVDPPIAAVPEPATMVLFGSGLLGIFFRRKFIG